MIAPVADLEDRPVGVMCAWLTDDRPHGDALQADPRMHDRLGPPCVISLAMAPPQARPIADDPALVHVRRNVLRDGRPCLVSLLTNDPVSVAGAVTVARAARPHEVASLADDPFARLWSARRLRVGQGVFGAQVRRNGPCLERYAGQPWPYDRFKETGDNDAT